MQEENQEKQKPNKANPKAKIAIVLACLALIGGAYATYWYLHGSHFEETEDAYVAADQNAITAQISSTVTELNIQDGKQIRQGYTVLQLDKTDYALALEKAKLELARMVRSFKTLQLNQSESHNNLDVKLSELAKINADFQRDNTAYKSGVLSEQDWLNTKHKHEQAKLAVDGAKSAYANSKVQAVAKSIYEHPEIAKAITAYKQAYIDLKRTEIKAPVDGVIAKRAVYIGQKIAPNQTLFSIINLNNEWVDVNLKESQLKKIKVGQSVELISDVNNKIYHGYVSSIGGGSGSSLSLLPAQNATGNWIKIVQRVPIRVDFDKQSLQKNGILPIGTSMRVSIDTTREFPQSMPAIENQKTDIYKVDEKSLQDEIEHIILVNKQI